MARILSKGYQICQYFPLRLSKAFVVSCLFGEDAVNTDLFIESSSRYVSEDERKEIERCRSGDIEADDEDLLELLSNFECKRVVKKDVILQICIELAHKELVQRPQYVADCWREILGDLRASFPSVESLSLLYSQLTPTTSKVLDAMVCEPNNTNFSHPIISKLDSM